MNQQRISEATMRVRDAIAAALAVRAGEVLTDDIIRDRAANGAHYVMEALREMAEESKPPPVRFPVTNESERT